MRLDEQTHALTVTDLRTHHEWVQQPLGTEFVIVSAKGETGGMRLALHDNSNNLDLEAVITLSASQPEVDIRLSGTGALKSPVSYPQAFASGAGTWLIVPMNEGIMYPADDASIPNRTLVAYGGHGICMPWYGVTNPATGEGFMTILRTPDDARIEITRRGGQELYVRPQWEGSRGQFAYARTIQKEKDHIAASYRAIDPLVRRLGYDEMTSHEFVTPDHAVQRTRWKSRTEIVVNFRDAAYKLPDGRVVSGDGLRGQRQIIPVAHCL